MIDFRYHLVSIVAIFLALAIGIVFGATALRGVTLRTLQHEATSLHNEVSAKNVANRALSQRVGADETFAQADAPLLLADEMGATLIVVVGMRFSMAEFLDKGRSGMASAVLTRMKVGDKIVDAALPEPDLRRGAHRAGTRRVGCPAGRARLLAGEPGAVHVPRGEME